MPLCHWCVAIGRTMLWRCSSTDQSLIAAADWQDFSWLAMDSLAARQRRLRLVRGPVPSQMQWKREC